MPPPDAKEPGVEVAHDPKPEMLPAPAPPDSNPISAVAGATAAVAVTPAVAPAAPADPRPPDPGALHPAAFAPAVCKADLPPPPPPPDPDEQVPALSLQLIQVDPPAHPFTFKSPPVAVPPVGAVPPVAQVPGKQLAPPADEAERTQYCNPGAVVTIL